MGRSSCHHRHRHRHQWCQGRPSGGRRHRARPRRPRLPAADPPPRLDRAGARSLVAGDGRGAARTRPTANGHDLAGIGLSGQMHGSVFLDRRGAPIRPALLVERRPHPCRVRRDRPPARARAGDRDHRQPRQHRDAGAQAAVAARTSPTPPPGSPSCSCPRTSSACGSPASTRPTPPTRPAPCSSTSPAATTATRSWPPWRCRRACCRGCSRGPRSPAG